MPESQPGVTILDAIASTPLVRVDDVWVKLEFLNPSGSIEPAWRAPSSTPDPAGRLSGNIGPAGASQGDGKGRRMTRLVSLVALGLVVAACSPTVPESPPSSSGIATAPAIGPSVVPSATPEPSPPAATSGPSTNEPSPSAASSPTPSPPSVPTAWTQVVGEADLGGDQVTGVVGFPGGLLAFGQGEGHVPMWLSSDGRTWNRVPDQASLRDPNVVVTAVAAGPTGFVAIGETQRKGAALTSRDGLTWQRSPDQTALRPPAGQTIRMAAVISTPDGYVAVGGSVANVGPALQAVAPMTWTSSDGGRWTRGSPIVAPGINLSAIALSPIGLTAIGGPYNPPLKTVVVRSTDGRHWSRLPDQPTFKGASVEDLAFAGGQLVAGGIAFRGEDPYPAVWASKDGRTWRYWRLSRTTGQVFHVAAIGTGVGAAGPSTETTGVWVSKDARRWIVDKPPIDAPYDLAAVGGLIVVVGLDGIWIDALP
jgi:hypothetical protein